jgi:hypothetical protein
MRTNKVTTDRRKSERRISTDRSSGTVRVAKGERREGEQKGMVASMVDALEDILAYERASERSLRAAGSN